MTAAREYPISSGWRLVFRGLAVAAALFGAALFYFALERFSGSRAAFLSLLGAFAIALGIYLLMGAARVWVIITPTELVYREPFQEKNEKC